MIKFNLQRLPLKKGVKTDKKFHEKYLTMKTSLYFSFISLNFFIAFSSTLNFTYSN